MTIALAIVIFSVGMVPAASATESIQQSCVHGDAAGTALAVFPEDRGWLDVWFTHGELDYVMANGLTDGMYQCMLDRMEAGEKLAAAPISATASPAKDNGDSTVVSVSSGVEQWRPLVETYFPSDWVEWALRIMQCESGGDPNAKNPHSSASGLFQHLARLWPGRAKAAGWTGASVFNPEANIAVAAWLLHHGGRNGPWTGTNHWECKASK